MSSTAPVDGALARRLVLDELFDLSLHQALRESARGAQRATLEQLIPVETRHFAFWQDFFDLRLSALDAGRRLKLAHEPRDHHRGRDRDLPDRRRHPRGLGHRPVRPGPRGGRRPKFCPLSDPSCPVPAVRAAQLRGMRASHRGTILDPPTLSRLHGTPTARRDVGGPWRGQTH